MFPNASIVGCIDNSSSAQAVCLYSSWLANTLASPLTFLHALEKQPALYQSDLSGSIGFDSKDHLMDELVKLEGKRARLMIEQGKALLDAAKSVALDNGVNGVDTVQTRGDLPDILNQLQHAQIIVLGRTGERSEAKGHIGGQLESVIRLQKTPIFISVNDYIIPRRVMFAYDGSAEGKKNIERLLLSPLLKNCDCRIVMNGSDQSALIEGQRLLARAGINAKTALIAGRDIPESLCQYAKSNRIELIIMGAYGHSTLRTLFVGSNTTAMIAKTHVPLLMLR